MTAPSVLVIESEPWLGEQYERTLVKNGFNVMLTSNAYSAIEIIDDVQPAAIVMGLLLSGASGLSLLHELQSYIDTADIPIIVCSSSPTAVSLDELRPYGIVQVLDMGAMRPEDLPAAIRSALA